VTGGYTGEGGNERKEREGEKEGGCGRERLFSACISLVSFFLVPGSVLCVGNLISPQIMLAFLQTTLSSTHGSIIPFSL
jgi:D-alanyl-D-alanine carboxypeptidase